MNDLNIEHLSIYYKNELELKNNEIELLSKQLNELNEKIKKEKENKQLLLLENKKIKEIFSNYHNYKRKEKQEYIINKDKKKNNIENKNKNLIKKELQNIIILNACNFYNNINIIFKDEKKNIIETNKYKENLINDISSLYELETKFQLIENNIFQNK